MEQELELGFGAMCEPLSKQLKAQNFKFDPKMVSYFQKESEAITRLKISGLLGDSIAKKTQDKLFNRILKHIAKLNS